ncbi:hypothetical protein HWI79_1308 [Cryptosporidium felis]|nr:hypothetical protein HWI79_1308 [Cryptosporidium felis]
MLKFSLCLSFLFALSLLLSSFYLFWDEALFNLISKNLKNDQAELFLDENLPKQKYETNSSEFVPIEAFETSNETENRETQNFLEVPDRLTQLKIESPLLKSSGNSFFFPVHLNPNGFRLKMRIHQEIGIYPIKVIFTGRDLKNLINIVIEDCRIYLFSKIERNKGYLFDSSPLIFPMKKALSLNLFLDWFEETFRISTVNQDGSHIPLASIVKTDSPLVASGSAFIGDFFDPLQIEWELFNSLTNPYFGCRINYYEERCKSNSVEISKNLKSNFLGLKPDEGYLKIAFQLPPKFKLPVEIPIEDGENIKFLFFHDQMVIKTKEILLKHFFSEAYIEGEWINLDLVPISHSSLNFLIYKLGVECQQKFPGGKYDCLGLERNKNLESLESEEEANLCKVELRDNLERSKQIAIQRIKSPENSERNLTKIIDLKPSGNNSRLFIAIDNEIIGNITMGNEIPNKFSLNSKNYRSDDSTGSYYPLGYWRLKAGLPRYIENLVGF